MNIQKDNTLSVNLLRCRAELSLLAARSSLDELIQSGLDMAERLTSSKIGYFHFVDADQENLTLQTWSTNTLKNMCKAEGKGAHYPISKAGVWVDCFHGKKPVMHNDYAALSHKKGLPEGHAPIFRVLSVPVMRGNAVVAIMGVGNKETDYTEDDAEVIMEAASILFDFVQGKRAENSLRESEERFRATFEQAAVGIAHISLEGRFMRVNRRFCEIMGYTSEELLARSFQDITDPGDKETDAGLMMQLLAGEIPAFSLEKRNIRKDGSRIWVNLTVSLARKAIDNTPDYFIRAVDDITLRKGAEEALRLARKEIDGLFNLSPDLLCIVSMDGFFRRVNPSFSQILGYEGSEVIDRSFLDFIHPDDRERSIREFRCARQGGTILNFDVRCIAKDGGIRWLSWSALMDSDVGLIYAIGRNITGRKRAEMELLAAKETAEEATQLKDKFVSLVAHDLKGPLGSMVAYLKQLKRNSFSPEDAGKIYGTAIATGENMLAMIENLLNISRIKTGKLKPELKFVSAYFFAMKAMAEFRYRAEQKGVKLVNDVSKDARLFADEALFYEAVRNLISNAIKFTGPGKCVRIFTPEGKPSAIAVSDEGMGIDDARVVHLFEYETKTSTPGTAGEMGTGLGLPLSRDIVEAHGGTLTVESVKGKGSVFSAELPPVKPKVLFADDDRLAGMFLERCIAGMGLELKSADNGREAIEALGVWRPDLIISEVKIPVVDGFEMVDFIRKNPATATIPIIMTSAFPDPELAARVTGAHVDGFISKPFIAEEVVSKIRRILG